MPKLKLFNGREAQSIHEVAAAMVIVTTCYLREKKKPLPPAPTQKEPVLISEARVKLKSGTKYLWEQKNYLLIIKPTRCTKVN
jgi:hypothetical protein